MDLRRSPLHEEHVALGAKMAPFAGWEMPIEYAGVLKEHRAVREAVGVFDLTHLGKVEVTGLGALATLQRTLTNDLGKVAVGEAQYNLALTPDGGIVDDLIAYRLEDERWLVVPNAANTEAVLEVLEDAAEDAEVRHRPDLATIAVQGPAAFDLLAAIVPGARDLPFMGHAMLRSGDLPVLVARSGYTGEPGVELFPEAEHAGVLWGDLIDRGRDLGIHPCGLGARDTLRLEMGYPLHGNDIDRDHTPLEAGLSWAVALDKGGFTGRDALAKQKEEGITRRLRGLRMRERKPIPRPHYPVFAGGEQVGETTSGTFSPTLRVGIAMAYLDPAVEPGAEVEVDVRGTRGVADVAAPPFVDASPK